MRRDLRAEECIEAEGVSDANAEVAQGVELIRAVADEVEFEPGDGGNGARSANLEFNSEQYRGCLGG